MVVRSRSKAPFRRKPKKTADCIAYLCAQRNLLYVSRKFKTEVVERWKIESAPDGQLFIPRRQLCATLIEVRGFVSPQLMDCREGDERICKGCKCTGSHAAEEKQCTDDSLWSKELAGYFDCQKAEPNDTCTETYMRIGYTYDWKYFCTEKYSDLPVYRWVCLP